MEELHLQPRVVPRLEDVAFTLKALTDDAEKTASGNRLRQEAIIPSILNLIHFPLKLFPYLCLLPDDTNQSHIIFTLLFCCGISTVFQATLGIKYPVVMSPSAVFISAAILFSKSSHWEMFSSGDLYAMGPSLRHEEYIIRTGELRGIIIVCSMVSSIICGVLWYFAARLPPATISATLISFSLSNVSQLLVKEETSVFIMLVFFLPVIFYCSENLKIPYPPKMGNEHPHAKIKIIRQLSVLLSFLIFFSFNMKLEEGTHSLLKRAVGTQLLYLPFKDFTLPKLSTKSFVLMPAFCSHLIVSYCCYQTLSKEKERYLQALLIEAGSNVISALTGIAVPLTVDPTSIGLIQMTRVKNIEPSVITGGLFILFSTIVPLVALLSLISYPILSGLGAFLFGQLFSRGLKEIKKDETDSTTIVAISILSGMVVSSVPIEIGNNLISSIIGFVLKCPIIVTFFTSIMLTLASRTANVQNE